MKKMPKSLYSAVSDKNSAARKSFKRNLRNNLFREGKTVKKSLFSEISRPMYYVPATLGVLLIAGTTLFAYKTTNASKSNEKALLANVALPSDLSAVKPIDEIRTLASTGLADGVTVVGVELDNEDGTLLYKVKFSDGTVKFYDANSGELVTKPVENETSEIPSNFTATISVDQARTIAQDQEPGKTIVKIEFEMEDGKAVYMVIFSDKTRLLISADDGSIIQQKTETHQETEDQNESHDDGDHESDSSNSGSSKTSNDDSHDESHSGSGSSGSGR
ncbi:PepSY domain-containing protein [Candidatus Saccharibacteria bacterium]|nr:PepSY domain-containing protein [Candidatus Saccharibacteria bacterium]